MNPCVFSTQSRITVRLLKLSPRWSILLAVIALIFQGLQTWFKNTFSLHFLISSQMLVSWTEGLNIKVCFLHSSDFMRNVFFSPIGKKCNLSSSRLAPQDCTQTKYLNSATEFPGDCCCGSRNGDILSDMRISSLLLFWKKRWKDSVYFQITFFAVVLERWMNWNWLWFGANGPNQSL